MLATTLLLLASPPAIQDMPAVHRLPPGERVEIELGPGRVERFEVVTDTISTNTIYVLSEELDTHIALLLGDRTVATRDDEGGGFTPLANLNPSGNPTTWTVEVRSKGDAVGRATVHHVLREESQTSVDLHAVRDEVLEEARRLREAGDVEDAIHLLEAVIGELLAIDSLPLSKHIVYAAERLAIEAYHCGEHDLARRAIRRALEGRRRALPPTHPHLFRTAINLVEFLTVTPLPGHALAEAENIIREMPREGTRELDILAKAYTHAADNALTMGRFDKARELAHAGCEELATALGGHHARILKLRSIAASSHRWQGDPGRAQAELEELDEELAESFPPTAIERLLVRHQLGRVLIAGQRLDEAEAVLAEVLDGLVALGLESKDKASEVELHLAIARMTNGRYAEALQAFDRLRDRLPRNMLASLYARIEGARCLKELGRTAEAAVRINAVREEARRYPRVWRALRDVEAMIAYAAGDHLQARSIGEEHLELARRAGWPTRHELFAGLNHVLFCLSTGDDAAALELARELAEVPLGPNQVGLADDVRFRLAAALHYNGLQEESLAALDSIEEPWYDAIALRALLLEAEGDVAGALATVARIVDRPDLESHPFFRGIIEGMHAHYLARLGHRDELVERARALARGLVEQTTRAELALSGRQLDAQLTYRRRGLLADLIGLACSVPDDEELARSVFAAAATLHGAFLVPAHLSRLTAGAEQVELRRQLSALAARITAALRDGATVGSDLDELVRRRDALETELLARLRDLPAARSNLNAASAARTGAVLADGEAALLFASGRDGWNGREGRSRSVAAAVVLRSGSIRWIELGPVEKIESLVHAWRSEPTTPEDDRGLTITRRVAEPAEGETGHRLRQLLLDPVIAWSGPVDRLLVIPAGALTPLPLDALPARSGGHLGDDLEIAYVDSLRALDAESAPRRASPSLLALGGVDYEAAPGESAGAYLTRSSTVGSLSPLPGSAAEVDEIARVFAESFQDARSEVLRGKDATRANFTAAVNEARFLHLATHGWFAQDQAQRLRAEQDKESFGLGTRVLTYAPMSLCGLAFAGANRAIDESGPRPGLMTAEELAALDLSGCELAVLSACETAVGYAESGRDVASLQRALAVAGARYSLTSVWAVPDEATRELMVAFYEGLWERGLSPRRALWRAKCSLRDARDGAGRPRHATRDWAGWILSGPAR